MSQAPTGIGRVRALRTSGSTKTGAQPTISDLPVQLPRDPSTPAQSRARFFNPGNAFDIQLPDVPSHAFIEEARQALDPETSTGLITCDLSPQLDCPFPATTPWMLVRYARIRSGHRLETDIQASAAICYVITGSGCSRGAGQATNWSPGDVIVLPGGEAFTHEAAEDTVLWMVTNEPQLAFEGLRPPLPGSSPTALVHFRAEEISQQLHMLQQVGRNAETAGIAVVFSSDQQEQRRNLLPSLTLAMNALPAHGSQRAHRHNAAAVMLLIDADGCHSRLDGVRKNWSRWATSVTPPGCSHSHHNDSNRQAMFLVVQDAGIYYHARAMGFSFTDAQ